MTLTIILVFMENVYEKDRKKSLKKETMRKQKRWKRIKDSTQKREIVDENIKYLFALLIT